MSNIGTILKRLLQAAAAAFDAPPESVGVVDGYGNEWTYVQERTCHNVQEAYDGLYDEDDFVCSECECHVELYHGVRTIAEDEFNYCPNCGAKVVERGEL